MRNTNEKLRDVVLPSPSVLDSYESMAPGSVKKMITMSEKEQANRHSLQRKYFFSYILGQFFSFALGASVIYMTYCLAKMGDVISAMKVASIYFGIFIVALVYAGKKKGISSDRRNTRRHHSLNRRASGQRRPQQRRQGGSSSRGSRVTMR